MAAARAGYHLHLYEPDVDRDGFGIVAEDEDTVGWYQTKAVLSSAGTAEWKISVGFLRPSQNFAEAYRFDPPERTRYLQRLSPPPSRDDGRSNRKCGINYPVANDQPRSIVV
jgi:hypothetical protein